MTPEEYVQLKAFARQDGALLSLLWIGGFACYVQGLAYPVLGLASMLLMVVSPFFAAGRLRHFRDYAREGIITFSRGYAYTILIFFYAGLLLAAAIFIYFSFIDDGYLLGKLTSALHSCNAPNRLCRQHADNQYYCRHLTGRPHCSTNATECCQESFINRQRK